MRVIILVLCKISNNIIFLLAVKDLRNGNDYNEETEQRLEDLCLTLVEEYLTKKMTTVKGKRKGKLKSSFVEVNKKNKQNRKKQNLMMGFD